MDAQCKMLRAIDLFAGCGGVTEGLKQAGFAVSAAVELSSLAVETYRMNHPEVHLWHGDIRHLDPYELRRALRLRQGQLHLLAACPPCQGFSSIRTLNGAAHVTDARNDLVLEVLRFAREFRPKVIMMENVPALAEDARMSTFVQGLVGMGYAHQEPFLVDAKHYGVPQRRVRMIYVTSRGGRIDISPRDAERLTVWDQIGHLQEPGAGIDPLHDYTEKRGERVARLIRMIPRDGGSRTDLPAEEQLNCHLKTSGFRDVYGRMAWDRVAPTITGGCISPSKGRFLHPSQHRAITLREAALLQSFPEDYQFSLRRGRYAVADMIGNALPPAMIREIALSVRSHLRGEALHGSAQA